MEEDVPKIIETSLFGFSKKRSKKEQKDEHPQESVKKVTMKFTNKSE
jgi:translation initiation factor IF-3